MVMSKATKSDVYHFKRRCNFYWQVSQVQRSTQSAPSQGSIFIQRNASKPVVHIRMSFRISSDGLQKFTSAEGSSHSKHDTTCGKKKWHFEAGLHTQNWNECLICNIVISCSTNNTAITQQRHSSSVVGSS